MSAHSWRYRDGGRVVQLAGRRWMFEFVYSRRRRNQWNVREPFTATLKFWPKDTA